MASIGFTGIIPTISATAAVSSHSRETQHVLNQEDLNKYGQKDFTKCGYKHDYKTDSKLSQLVIYIPQEHNPKTEAEKKKLFEMIVRVAKIYVEYGLILDADTVHFEAEVKQLDAMGIAFQTSDVFGKPLYFPDPFSKAD